MKIIAVVAALLLLCAGVVVWLYLGIRPQVAVPAREITVRDASGVVSSLPPTSTQAESIREWLRSHPSGWRPSFVTYAPQITFSADTFQINIVRDAIVLNYSGSVLWRQITRSLSSDERTFWETLFADAKRPNQAMQLTAVSFAIYL